MNFNLVFSIFLCLVQFCCCGSIESVHQPSVRVVNDFEIFSNNDGVPIDFSYNETDDKESTHQKRSAPGCPHSIEGYPWVYNKESTACYLTGFQGPCLIWEIFMPQRNSSIGICVCDCLLSHKLKDMLLNTKQRYIFCPDPSVESTKWKDVKGTIYDKSEKECYVTLKRDTGPCKGHQMIGNWTAESIICLPRCDFRNTDWKESRERGECQVEPTIKKTGARSILRNEDCESGENYSNLLKKCVGGHSWADIF